MAPSADLVLPPPTNEPSTPNGANPKAARVEEVQDSATTGASATTAAADAAPTAQRFATGGIIYPPPDIRGIVDKTAAFVARTGTQFEARIRAEEKGNSKFAFLNESDPYHAYYRSKIEAVKSGEAAAPGTPGAGDGAKEGIVARMDGKEAADEERVKEEEGKPEEPPVFEFSADLPNITAVDLDVLKLTALFTARKGRSFATALQAQEGRSYQFEFLRPSHSLFGYFNRLVEQYRLVMDPPPLLLKGIREGAFGGEDAEEKLLLGAGRGGGRQKTLEKIKRRIEWERWVRERRKRAEDEQEKERAAFEEIDWQDFVVAGTVELTETDAHIDLPPPMSLREVENMTMAQKRMAAMIMEVEGVPEEEAKQTVGIVELPGGDIAGANAGQSKPVRAGEAPSQPADEDGDMEMEMDESDDEDRPPQVEQIKRADGHAPMKIRKDYVPKTLAQRQTEQTTVCPVCRQTVGVNEMEEHVRIELLDPKYREQRRDLDAKRAQQSALYAGADPSRFLKQFAGARTDIFGQKAEEEARARREEEERRQAKEREKIVWDGHAASRTNTVDQYQKTINLEEQIANIQRRHRLNAEESNIGPQMGPSQQGPAGYDQGMPPQAEGMPPNLPPGVGLPGRPPMPSYMSQDGSGSPVPPSGPSAGSPAPGIHPSRMQAGIDPSRAAGLKRPAEGEPAEQPPPQRPAMMEQSEGGYPGMQQPYYGGPPPGVPAGPAAMGSMSPPAGAPTAPRQDAPRPPVQVNSLPKKTDGTLYPEEDWLRYNHMPVTLSIKLPDAPNVSPKCDGSTVTFEALPPASPVSAIRDRVHAEILESTVGASKLKLEVNGKAMTLKQTLAYWNLLDGDTITVSLRK